MAEFVVVGGILTLAYLLGKDSPSQAPSQAPSQPPFRPPSVEGAPGRHPLRPRDGVDRVVGSDKTNDPRPVHTDANT